MSSLIDLHLHSRASDGLLSPAGLVKIAAASGVSAIALTDHDTIDGIGEARRCAAAEGITFIPGIEFSVEYAGSFHLVGLFIDHECPLLSRRVAELKKRREDRAARMHADLSAHGVDIPYDEVLGEAKGASIGKPHFARVLVKYGYAGSFDEVFTKYLEKGMPGYADKAKIPHAEGISLILKAGGIPILAHPVSLGLGTGERLEEHLRRFINEGLRGIEVYATMHSDEDVRDLLRIAEKHALLVSGGSDFHGEEGDSPMGHYGAARPIPPRILDELIRARG